LYVGVGASGGAVGTEGDVSFHRGGGIDLATATSSF
jgi:hypothetical protein